MSFDPELIDRARMFVLACQRARIPQWRDMLAARFSLSLAEAGALLEATEKPAP
jgi:hypothetical protein